MTQEQMDRQDKVDVEIFSMLKNIIPNELNQEELEWDIELIGEIRDIAQKYFLEHGIIENEEEFYP